MSEYRPHTAFAQIGPRWGHAWPTGNYDTRDALILALSSMVGMLVERATESGSTERAMANDVMRRAQELCGSPVPQIRRDQEAAETSAKSVPA